MKVLKHLFRTVICIGLGTAAAYLVIKYVAPVFAPFIAAAFFALLIEPLVAFLQKKGRLPRAAAVGSAMLALFGGTGLLFTLAVGRLIVELVHLSAFLPEYIRDINTVIVSARNRIEAYYFTLPKDVLDFINAKLAGSEYSLDALLGKAQVIIGGLLNFMLQTVSAVPAWVILFIISAIATYFIAKDRRVIIEFWLRVLPAPWGRKSLEITKEIFQAVIGYVRAQLILISLTFLQSLTGLYIIGAPYALLMALVIGLADIIPVLGPSSIYLPWIVWELVTGDIGFAVKLGVLYAIIIVVRQVLETKIVSKTMGLHPLATLIAMYVGLQVLGPLGVIAGPLFIITVKAFATAGVIGWPENSD